MLVHMFVVSVCECVSVCVYLYMCLSGWGKFGLCRGGVSWPVFGGGGLHSPYITPLFDTPFKQAPLGAGLILGMEVVGHAQPGPNTLLPSLVPGPPHMTPQA